MPTAAIQSVGNSCLRTEIIQIIEFRRLTFNRIILKDKITKAVEYRLALIDFNATPNMRPMTDVGIRSMFQTEMCEVPAKVCWQFLIHPLALMGMMANEYNIRLTASLCDRAKQSFCIGAVHARLSPWFTGFEADIAYKATTFHRFCKAFLFI